MMGVPTSMVHNRFKSLFGDGEKVINDRKEAIQMMLDKISIIQEKLLKNLKEENTYDMFMKLHYIFDEVHAIYLAEKKARTKLARLNIQSETALNVFIENRNIMRSIIDSCNVWIENCILYQHDADTMASAKSRGFSMDYELIIDLYICGALSQAISLLTLSKGPGQSLFYGLKITPQKNVPFEVLKYHPVIFYNTIITGNQDSLVCDSLTSDANESDFGKAFSKSHGVEFLLFLAALKSFQEDLLHGDDKALTIIGREKFINLVENYTRPRIDGKSFYNSFVLTKEKVKKQLRDNEDIIWITGANKERYELRPFVGLENGNVLISYAALEQSKQLWISYFSNGGMCYSNQADVLSEAMGKRNQELSDILVDRIRLILNKHYQATVDEKDVKFQRIFGERDINYGDYDIVFYSEDSKELFLIEAKYFSDSLNSSAMITDYDKLFGKGEYYNHCRQRYDLVLSEPDKIKKFINADGDVITHLIFLSSKPIELDFQDEDKVVTFLSLGLFEKYILGKLINEDDSVARPTRIL